MFNIQALSWKIGGSSLLQVGVSLIQVFILAWETEEEGGGVVRLGGVSGANADVKVMKILSIL